MARRWWERMIERKDYAAPKRLRLLEDTEREVEEIRQSIHRLKAERDVTRLAFHRDTE